MPLFDIPRGEEGTKEVLKWMSKLTNSSVENSDLIEFTNNIVSEIPEKDFMKEAQILYEWVRDNIRYVKDPLGQETVYSAEKTLGLEKQNNKWILNGRMAGDCDCQCIVLASMLKSIGMPTRFVAIKTPMKPTSYSHVYAEVSINNKWYPMDTIIKKHFGWEYPFTLQKLIIDNQAGRITKEPALLSGIGDPFMVVEGLGSLFGRIGNMKTPEFEDLSDSVGGWFSSPIIVFAVSSFGYFLYKLIFKKGG